MPSAFVTEAREWAMALVQAEARTLGDHGQAMRRVAESTKVPWTLIFNLHYRLPKTLCVDHYAKLGAHYVALQNRYRADRASVEPKTALGRALLQIADRLDREDDGPVTRKEGT